MTSAITALGVRDNFTSLCVESNKKFRYLKQSGMVGGWGDVGQRVLSFSYVG